MNARRGRTRYPGLIDSKALSNFPSQTSLVLDLHAAIGVWQDAAMTTPAVADTDPVWTWQDMSGAGNHHVQATAGSQPKLRTGVAGSYRSVEFDGGDNLYLANAIVGRQYATVYMVVYMTSATEHGVIYGIGDTTNGWKYGVGGDLAADDNDITLLFDNVKWINTGYAIGLNMHLLTLRMQNYAPYFWLDGVFKGNTTGTPNAPSAMSWIGSGAQMAGRDFTDNIVRIIACNAQVSDVELTATNNYLMELYGI